MRDDQALVLENYDIKNGKLVRRKGYTSYNNAALNRYPIQALIPYVAPQTDKNLLVLMAGDYFPFNAADTNISVMRVCDEASATCSTLVVRHPGFFGDRRNQNSPYNVNYTVVNNRLVLAVANSEMRIWDGTKMYPARPRAPGQAYAIPLDGDGTMNGIFRYRAVTRTSAGNYSDLSVPTWPVRVKDGNIFVGDLGPFSSALQDSAAIYRSKDGGTYQKLLAFDDITGGNGVTVSGLHGFLVDTTKETDPADTLPYPWGYHTNCIFGACSDIDSALTFGEMRVALGHTVVGAAGYGVTRGLQGLTDSTCVALAYSLVYVDSAGRQSYASPPVCLSYSEATLRAITLNHFTDSLYNALPTITPTTPYFSASIK